MQVLRNGCILYFSLIGKRAVGLLFTPKFEKEGQQWRGSHWRDCAVVGEAEFAFLVAVFGVTEQLIPPDLYASVVLAILMSTIISPLLLRTLLAVYPMVQDVEGDISRSSSRDGQNEARLSIESEVEPEDTS